MPDTTATQTYLTELEVEGPQQGTDAQTVQPEINGVDPRAIQWNNWNSGSVGSRGNKFS